MIINEACEDAMGKQAELNRLLPAIDYVSKYYAQSITIQELAAVCQISASHFMRIFKTSLQMTAYSFVEHVRTYHAIEALRSGTASITQIALDLWLLRPQRVRETVQEVHCNHSAEISSRASNDTRDGSSHHVADPNALRF